MNVFTIYSGPVVLIASGVAIAYSGNPIEIRFGLPPNAPEGSTKEIAWTLTFEFKDDPDNTSERVQPEPFGESSLTLRLYNFNNQLGSGTEQPVQIGKLRGRPLWLHFRVYHFTSSDKSLLFSVYHERIAAPTGVRIS
jgi:hypothetical protein